MLFQNKDKYFSARRDGIETDGQLQELCLNETISLKFLNFHILLSVMQTTIFMN